MPGIPSPEREAQALVHVSRHHEPGHRVVVIYPDGESEGYAGSLLDACELARSQGLTVVLTSDESIRWERPPEAWRPE